MSEHDLLDEHCIVREQSQYREHVEHRIEEDWVSSVHPMRKCHVVVDRRLLTVLVRVSMDLPDEVEEELDLFLDHHHQI